MDRPTSLSAALLVEDGAVHEPTDQSSDGVFARLGSARCSLLEVD